jgi:hypothetical protein
MCLLEQIYIAGEHRSLSFKQAIASASSYRQFTPVETTAGGNRRLTQHRQLHHAKRRRAADAAMIAALFGICKLGLITTPSAFKNAHSQV